MYESNDFPVAVRRRGFFFAVARVDPLAFSAVRKSGSEYWDVSVNFHQ